MCSEKSPESTSICARVVTLRTTERVLTRMSQQVSLEITSLYARESILIALERLFSGMFLHVHLQMISYRARVLALVATVGFSCFVQGFYGDTCHLNSNSNTRSDDNVLVNKVEG